MPVFTYRAVDADGKASEGTLEAASAHACVVELTEQGLRVNAVEAVEERGGRFLRKRGALTWQDLDLFNEQLRTITKSGLPLASSLNALASELKGEKLKRVVRDIRFKLEAGASLAEALEGHPESFSPVYRSMVRAGERSGNLSGVLSHLCTYSTRMVELKHRLQEIMAYPAFVVVAVCAVVGFILAKIVPEFMEFYDDFGAELPFPTRSLAFLSTALRHRGAEVLTWVSVGAVALVFLGYFLRRSATGSYAFDWLALHMPVFGARNHAGAVARFSRSLGMLLANEVPVLESVALAGEAAGNAVLRNAARTAARHIENGTTIANALSATGFFAGTYCWMLDNAERAGEVDAALLSLADACEQDLEYRDKLIVSMAGPITLLVLGVLVGFVVVALYLPLYTIGDAIG